MAESECLDPGAYQGNVVCALSSNTSLSLTLDVIHWPATCEYISSPVQKYTVHYKMVDNIHSLVTSSCVDSPDSCQKLVSIVLLLWLALDILSLCSSFSLELTECNFL